MRRVIIITSVVLSMAVLGCGGGEQAQTKETAAEAEPKPQFLPKVTDERTDLVLSWYVDGVPEVGSKVSDVPDEAKKQVRVQDPTIPPEKQNPALIYIADLTKKTGDGYQVKAVKRAAFEAKRQAEKEKAAAEALAAAGGPGAPPTQGGGTLPPITLPDGDTPPIIMYATKHCPVCVKARRWLLEQKIPYVEKDLETDRAALMEVQKKGQAQGVSTNGVPIFDVRGRLLPGFDPAQIVALLVRDNGKQKTI